MGQSHLTSDEVCRLLGIVPETLYAYVSRGMIRSEPGTTARGRLYRRSDVEALQQRRELRRRPQQVLRQSLDWGAPILDSGLTLIADGRLYYRGREALKLAEKSDFTQAALHFWIDRETAFIPKVVLPPFESVPRRKGSQVDLLAQFQRGLPGFAESDPVAGTQDAGLLLQTAVRLVLSLASVIARKRITSLGAISSAIGRSWRCHTAKEQRLLEQALILCVDHEMNISSFTARCAASAGASLYDAVNAALSAFRGHRHGGSTIRVESLFDEVTKQKRVQPTLTARMRRGKDIPGFGHPLYTEGDPRAKFILSALRTFHPQNPGVRRTFEIIKAAKEILGREPNIDFALVALCRAIQAPSGSALMLFALGRTVGWTGHAMEQIQTGQLIRPRARYTGLAPETVGV